MAKAKETTNTHKHTDLPQRLTIESKPWCNLWKTIHFLEFAWEPKKKTKNPTSKAKKNTWSETRWRPAELRCRSCFVHRIDDNKRAVRCPRRSLPQSGTHRSAKERPSIDIQVQNSRPLWLFPSCQVRLVRFSRVASSFLPLQWPPLQAADRRQHRSLTLYNMSEDFPQRMLECWM